MRGPRILLDAGTGDGKLARALSPDFDRVDAVDPSTEMLRVARRLPGGNAPGIRWIEARLEDAELEGPYGIATAGASFHWMDAERVLDHLSKLLAPGASLFLLEGDAPVGAPWADDERRVMQEALGRNGDAIPRVWLTPDDRLRTAVLDHPRFERQGADVVIAHFEQSVGDYVRCQYSRQSFGEEFLEPAVLAYFDSAMREALAPHALAGRLTMEIATRIEWGIPLPGSAIS